MFGYKKKRTWRTWLDDWQPVKVKITAPFLEMEFDPQKGDRHAAWELHVEMLTRVATQPLSDSGGDETSALNSVYELFDTTRQIMKNHGVEAKEFSKLAIIVLNVFLRPFLTKWHKKSLDGEFNDEEVCLRFRQDLASLQLELTTYNVKLADMAGAGTGLANISFN